MIIGAADSGMHDVDLLVVGAGPCGLAAAISAQRAGLGARVLDAGAVASTITQYPYYVKFFSTAEKLALGGMPFLVGDDKPTRREGLAYYRAIVRHFGLDVRQYERVTRLEQSDTGWLVHSESIEGEQRILSARAVCVATGYFGSPNYLGVPGRDAAARRARLSRGARRV
jgi:thioredoxin reductase (NADPH)